MSAQTIKTPNQKTKMYYVHSAIGLAIMFGFGFLPPFSTITPYGMDMLGILLGLIYLWSVVEVGWPCIMGLIAYLILGDMAIGDLISKGFGNKTVMISVFAVGFTVAIAKQGIFEYITNWILSCKIFHRRPWLLTFALILIMFVLDSMYANGIAILFIIVAMTTQIGESCGMEKQNRWYAGVVVGCVFALICGECLLPFKPMALMMINMARGFMSFGELPFATYIIFMFIISMIMLTMYILLLKFVLRVDVDKIKNMDLHSMLAQGKKMTKEQKICGFLLILFVLSMIIVGSASLFPDGVFRTFLQTIDITGVSMFFFVVTCIWRIDNKPVLQIKQIASDISWEVVLIISVVMTFCQAVGSADTGISAWIAKITGPILGGRSPLIFVVLMFIMTIILTNLMNNTVVILIMFNIVGAYAQTMELNLMMIVILLIIFSQIAFLLPASSIWGGICHSQAEICGKNNIYLCALLTIVAAILSLVFAIPLGNILFA